MVDVKALAQYQAEIVRIQIEVEGMKARNLERQDQGMSLAYTEEHFQDKADEVSSYSNAIIQLP